MEFEEQPIIYKCVEAIHQQPKCFIYNKTLHIAYGIWLRHGPDYNAATRPW